MKPKAPKKDKPQPKAKAGKVKEIKQITYSLKSF